MDNLISICFVIHDMELGVEPTIYLQHPIYNPRYQKVFMFRNAFAAKRFIRTDIRNDGKIFIKSLKSTSNVVPLERRTIKKNGWS